MLSPDMPTRALFCGDSHIKQVFETALCLLRPWMTSFVGHNQSGQMTVWQQGSLPLHCSGVWGAEHYWPPGSSPIVNGSDCIIAPAGYNHTVHFSEARFGGGALELRMAYMRDHRNIPQGLDEGTLCIDAAMRDLAASTHTQNAFDVVVVNTYVDTRRVQQLLRASRSKLIVLPKWKFSSETRRRFDSILNLSQGRIFTGHNAIDTLDVFDMLHARDADSKAHIYPFTYETENRTGHFEVCQANQVDPARPQGCREHPNWHIFTTQLKGFRPAEESHYCMPGPLDDVVRLLVPLLVLQQRGVSNVDNQTRARSKG